MRLNRVAAKLHKTPVKYWDKGSDQWVDTDLIGKLEVYDRFISDRSFGQRKRLFLTSPENQLQPAMKIIKVGDLEDPYMVESINQDLGDTYPHLSVHMLQEVPFRSEIYKLSGTKRPSGAVKDAVETLVDSTYCNLDRYGNLNAKGVLTVDFSMMSIYLPSDTTVDGDCFVKVQGETYDVVEVAPMMGITMLRAQKRG
ncbi:hypothetical protein [Endozoicomonas sp. ALC066]|uniref:hypothetical protein n=1 Tax=Endozoicomonas sp. ALC066 TaxID=3403078 RepID=UPI003BB6EFF3